MSKINWGSSPNRSNIKQDHPIGWSCFWCERRDKGALRLPLLVDRSALLAVPSYASSGYKTAAPGCFTLRRLPPWGSSPNRSNIKQDHPIGWSCFWCERRDLNPYGVNHTPLKRARLPVPPLSHKCLIIIAVSFQKVNT